MQYMVVERFKPAQAGAIYRRLAERGRMMPDGLTYINSWVSDDLTSCFQLMETDDFSLFAPWIREWEDLADFEIVRVIPSAEARSKALGT